MSIQESIRIVPEGDIALVEFDMVGEKVNKFSTPMMTRFREVIAELRKSSYKAVIISSKKPRIFIAGADIEEIKGMNKPEDFEKAVVGGQGVFDEIEDLPIPVIAAVNGACAGGGCEMILACDYRICSDDSSTRIGLPETKLGIIPGFGGCIRLPRVVGLQASLDVILAGKLLVPQKALKIGLVDRVCHSAILMDEAKKWAREIIKEASGKRRKTFKPKGFMNVALESPLGRSVIFSQAKKATLKQTNGHYPAPIKALEVIQKTYGMAARDRAMQIERAGFCEVAVTEVSKNLIHVFYLTEMVKKQNGVPGVMVNPLPVKKIGVLGAGLMGGGIAFVAADKGIEVRVKDVNYEAISKALKAARDLWNKLLKKKIINKYDMIQKMSHVSGTTDYSGFKQIDVVIEAIVEDMEIKKKVIRETAEQCRPDTVIATNTSSLSVTEMAEGHPHPAQFVGMHFFSPVDKMPLVEVIRGAKSSDQSVATVFELAKKMGKMPVVVKDAPGFLVNRLLLPYMAEAMYLLQDGMEIKTLDEAFVRKFGMPVGPFQLMDEVGLDVCVKVLKIFKKAFGSRLEVPALAEKLEKSGRLGKKNKKGFYKYDESGKRQGVDESIYGDVGLGAPKNSLDINECLERGVFMMINEVALALLEERLVETPHEVDLAMIMGTGFPPFRGGLLKYADHLGSTYIVDQLEVYANQYGPRFKPSNPLRTMAKTQRKFYS